MSPNDFPRLLIISPSAFNRYTGGGITFTNLFSGWPADKIATIHTDTFPPSMDVCQHYYRLSSQEIGWITPINLFLPNQRGAPSEGQETDAAYGQRRLYRKLLSGISLEGLQDSLRITPALRTWVEEYKPQVIYSILGSRAFVKLAVWAQQQSEAKLAIHIMDDWPETRYRAGVLAPWFHAHLQTELRSLIADTSGLFAISQKMAQAYSLRYGREFTVFSNALDVDALLPQARRDWKSKKGGTLRLLYAGSILENAQLTSLVDICAAASRLSASVDCEVAICTSSETQSRLARTFKAFRNTRFKPSLTDANLIPALAEADVLLLPVNFDRQSADYVRYSNPTKLPAYLLSGTPILAYGPKGVDQVDRAEESGWGLCVTSRQPAELEQAVSRLADDEALRARLGSRAQEVARRDHNVVNVRPAFQQLLRQLAAQT